MPQFRIRDKSEREKRETERDREREKRETKRDRERERRTHTNVSSSTLFAYQG